MPTIFSSNAPTTLNYALSVGANNNLLTFGSQKDNLLFQMNYTDVVATNVSVDVYISSEQDGTFVKIDGASKTLIPADNSVVIPLSGVSFAYVQFRLVVPTASTAGTITTVFAKQSL